MRKILIKVLRKIVKLIEPKQQSITEEAGCSELFGKLFYYHNKLAFDVTFEEIFQKGIYTFKTSNPNPIIIDCGSNMGLSLLFFSMNYPSALIYAFEPDETVLDYLVLNIKSYEMKQVVLFKKAIWISEGFIEFYTDKGMGGRLELNYVNQVPNKVETIRLKDFIGKQKIDFLKIDIEGAEYRVIEDCEQILKQIDNIFIEYHSIISEEQKLDNILLILRRNGFRYHLSQSSSREKPFVDNDLVCEKFDLAINIYAYKKP
jgi:FkbM family methyltransferase